MSKKGGEHGENKTGKKQIKTFHSLLREPFSWQ